MGWSWCNNAANTAVQSAAAQPCRPYHKEQPGRGELSRHLSSTEVIVAAEDEEEIVLHVAAESAVEATQIPAASGGKNEQDGLPCAAPMRDSSFAKGLPGDSMGAGACAPATQRFATKEANRPSQVVVGPPTVSGAIPTPCGNDARRGGSKDMTRPSAVSPATPVKRQDVDGPAVSPKCSKMTDEKPREFDVETQDTASASEMSSRPSSESSDALEKPSEEPGNGSHFRYDETLFIFDWDDTCLPSTWIQMQGLGLEESCVVSPSQLEEMEKVACVAAETLRVAKMYGTVVLVTNAEKGWIELSCQKFMPSLLPTLADIRFVSARTTYESLENATPLSWKLRAFESEMVRFFGRTKLADAAARKNIVSLGDSVHEREALMRMTSLLPNCRPKSLKFIERPDISQMVKQHELVTQEMGSVVHYDQKIDVLIRCH
eukprot:TRINITY_DN22594_c0_g1_i1.p1 TRINITY_DN22594_c0_g1~~TRINITY_DN22594_c0_g1_i1.p1  ORF type:complete len:433 (-),score=100.19 TRINITY_DN22594_c0_g1_i1:336-1634(-)